MHFRNRCRFTDRGLCTLMKFTSSNQHPTFPASSQVPPPIARISSLRMFRLSVVRSYLIKQTFKPSSTFTCTKSLLIQTSRQQILSTAQPVRYRALATMTSAQSKACCTVPPVVSNGYKEKGSFTTIAGMKTYVTGPSSAKSAILVVYDIFGFFPQTLQGADILAHADKEHQYQVIMPGTSIAS